MLEIGSQKVQNATPGDRWCFSSGQYPSGRFPKVSIGIMVEKCAKSGPGPRNEDAAVLPAESKAFSCHGAGETTRPGMLETLERNKSDVADHTTSAWFSSRSVCVETPMAETVKCFVNSASVLQSEDGGHKKTSTLSYGKRKEKGGDSERVEEVAFATVQEFVDKGSAREEPERTVYINEKKVNTAIFGKRQEKDAYVGRMEEVAFSTKQFLGEEKEKEPEVLDERSNEALKTKLWEILGNAPGNKHTTNSPKIMEYRESFNFTQSREKQNDKVAITKLNSLNLEENKENLNINQNKEYKKGKHARIKPNSRQLEEEKEIFNINQNRVSQKRKTASTRQNADAITTDSESPNQVIRRPVTRSLTQKKAPPKKIQDNSIHEKKLLSSSSSDFKLRVEGQNVFAFDEVEGIAGSFDRMSSGHSNRSIEQSNVKVELRKVHFPRSVSGKCFQKSGKQPSSESPNKISLQSKEKWNSILSSQDKKQFLQMQDGTRNDNHGSPRDEQLSFGSPLQPYNRGTRENTDSPLFKMKLHSWEHENSPPVQKSFFLHEDADRPSVGRGTDPLDDFHCPTLAMDTSPTLPTMPFNDVLSNPVAAQPSQSTHRNYNSKGLYNSLPGSYQPSVGSESDDTRETQQAEDVEYPVMNDEIHEKQFSISPMEEHDTESEADDLMSQGFGPTDKWFHSAGSPNKFSLSLHHAKRVRSLNNVKSRKANPSSPSPTGAIGTEEKLDSFEALVQLPEDSLGRCVAQLVLLLERFRRRTKSQADRRSSQILSAAADKIRQQLQNVESQILADVGKFNNSGKSKRKCLESYFQEQQERLKVIHDKFKEEVNQHLLDCSSILEELDAYNIEIKGAAERQKASHGKLILQVKEAMEVQINNAETSIAAIHKDARKKMIGLKRALKEWMD